MTFTQIVLLAIGPLGLLAAGVMAWWTTRPAH
jgi:hypothetical protein